MNAEREQMPPDHRTDPDERDDAALATDRDDLDRASTAPSVGDARDGTEMDETGDAMAGAETDETPARQPLLPEDRAGSYRERWEKIQVTFVDEPRTSVEEADRLVLDVIQQLQASFTAEREALEAQWQRGDDVETEQLRLALRRYRSFFDRLLAA